MNAATRLLVVGASVASGALVTQLHEEGFSGAVTVVDADPDAPYDRPPLSKTFLADSAARPEAPWWDESCEIVRGRATALDVAAGTVTVRHLDGTTSTLGGDHVVIATGAAPVRLPGQPPGVHRLRTAADARALRAAAGPGRRVVVLGAGAIGTELASSLVDAGCDVAVVDLADRPLDRFLAGHLGNEATDWMRDAGVTLHLSTRVHDVDARAGGWVVRTDAEYEAAGARILPTADDVWGTGDMILKVKEPIAEEYGRMRDRQVLFTYLHLAADKRLTDELLARNVTGIAYETVQSPNGALPLLAPMSQVAGRLAPQVGAATLMKAQGGRGVLMGGVPGVRPATVVVLGAGVSGLNAAAIAAGMQADVHLLDLNIDRLRSIDQSFGGRLRTVASNALAVEDAVLDADLVVGAVLVPGAKAPTLVTNDLVSRMKPGSVLVDISIDQGGCFEDSHPTTHADPTYAVHDSVFYCVANMPGAVPDTSTRALTNVTLPYAVALASKGWRQACLDNHGLALGVNTHAGRLVNAAVGEATGLHADALEDVLTD